jgi:hypothetical protein
MLRVHEFVSDAGVRSQLADVGQVDADLYDILEGHSACFEDATHVGERLTHLGFEVALTDHLTVFVHRCLPGDEQQRTRFVDSPTL